MLCKQKEMFGIFNSLISSRQENDEMKSKDRGNKTTAEKDLERDKNQLGIWTKERSFNRVLIPTELRTVLSESRKKTEKESVVI